MPNVRATDHPLEGQTFIYRPNDPPYDPQADTEPGTLLVAAGMTVTVLSVYHNWNDVPDLTIYYVRCSETGQTLHLSPAEIEGTK